MPKAESIPIPVTLVRTEIFIDVRDGVVTSVYSTKKDVAVEVIDYDNIDAGDHHPLGSEEEAEEYLKSLHQVY